MQDAEGEILSINNRGFSPILLLEYIARQEGWVPIKVITGDDNFFIRFPERKKMMEVMKYINDNY